MPEKSHAEVPFAFLEYRATFKDPIFEAWDKHGAIVRAAYNAFRGWNINLENISGKQQPANAGEIQVTFNLLNGRVLFNVGLGFASIFVTNPSWEEAELITKLARSGMEAVRDSAKAEIEKQLITLAMHLKPEGRSIRELTSQFVRTDVLGVMGNKVRAYGFSVYQENSLWVVDASALYPDALFARITRTFGPAIPFEEIAAGLRKDEDNLLELLELRVD